MDTLIASAESGFNTTTGFSVASLVAWAGSNLYLLFIGSGVAVLYELRYWIVGLIIIGAIIYFAFRAFGFFRH